MHMISHDIGRDVAVGEHKSTLTRPLLETNMAQPVSLSRDISPPPTRKASGARHDDQKAPSTEQALLSDAVPALDHNSPPSLAAIEAGEAQIRDHLAYFVRHLSSVSRPTPPSIPRLPIDRFQALYKRNRHPHGRHFVIHQHDHPISGSRVLAITPTCSR